VTVLDPAARNYTSWSVPGNRAVITALPQAGEPPPTCEGKGGAPSAAGSPRMVSHPKYVDLGIDTIMGIEARGTREIRTTSIDGPNGPWPVISTRDIWWATDRSLGIWIVKVVIDNPETGKYTQELVSFDQNEPYSTLFQPPQNYEIVTQAADQAPCSFAVEPELLKNTLW